MKKHLFIVIPVLLTLTACNLQPKYERPSVPVSGKWESNAYRNKTSDLAWQKFFDDDTLKLLIGLSLKNNRDLRVAALNIESARAQYRIERAALLPTIELMVARLRLICLAISILPRLPGLCHTSNMKRILV